MPNIQIPDDLPQQDKLAAMAFVAKLRDAANKAGISFVGGFITPDGEKFMMNNMDDDMDVINEMLPEELR